MASQHTGYPRNGTGRPGEMASSSGREGYHWYVPGPLRYGAAAARNDAVRASEGGKWYKN